MPQGSSSHGISAHVDLSHQSGVMAVLAAVRTSELTAAQKSELRDLIFEFTNGGRDETVRLQLEQKLSAYNVTVVPLPARGVTAQRTTEFGSIRPAPTFAPVTIAPPAPAPVPTPPSAPASDLPPTPAVSAAPPAPAPSPTQPITSPAAPEVTPSAAPAVPPQAPISVAPAVSPLAASGQSVQPPTPPAQPITPPTPAPATSPNPVANPPAASVPEQTLSTAQPNAVAADDTEASLRRIREIKAIVNEQVGNPVNLVDIDNAVGREYMAALLEAMKKIGSGGAGNTAMQRLEASFAAVQKILATKPPEVAVAPSPNVPPTPPPESETVAAPAPPSPGATQIPAPQQPQPVTPTEEQSRTADAASTPTPAIPQVAPLSESKMAPEIPPQSVASGAPSDAPPVPPPIQTSPNPPLHSVVAPVTASVDVPPPSPLSAADSPATPTSATSQPAAGIASLAHSELRLRNPQELPDPDTVSALGPNDDPLQTKEVDAGLEQLLLEWSLFKKSGLFGTGPKGREHPLFKKIAPLPIALLLAGRFDGATQEIKQSITDYMNGWRYEQGIVYEQGETFEKYLRRVIRHIIDLQKQQQKK